ncbi:MAG TPA: CoA transferase [Dehalococcoidia bacterium]|nr:CoA transferase [Dehalococcoidia bacterium]
MSESGLPTASDLLDGLLDSAGCESVRRKGVHISGSDPAFGTTFRLGAAGAASVAATLVAASGLWQQKTRLRQDVSLSMRESAAALRTDAYLRIDGKQPPAPWAPISGFYRTRDGGWIQLHCNFRHHHDGVLKALECEDDKKAVAAAVARWEGRALETYLSDAGLCAGFVHSGGVGGGRAGASDSGAAVD